MSIHAKFLITTVLVMTLCAVMAYAAKEPPKQPGTERFFSFCFGVLFISIFVQGIWWLWS